ncbi:hypothetical protein HPB49_011795 [Dermacentor silvarum]|uniref:Uncharacterized protein n=1 Tax=Dermacentor silvarum TaxID=543639 RepID=A0ACB8DNT3_DERSI|nr:hypothetical protein HPB49_011795 [Dermacentor silvarum]
MGLKTSKSPTPGPFRPASKSGAFITTLAFPDVYDKFRSLSSNQSITDTKTCTLGGYTLAVQCKLTMDKSGSSDHGEWDNHVVWPFEKKVTLILAHPRDYSKDISSPILLDQKSMVRKPEPGHGNPGGCSSPVKWEQIDSSGFIVNKSLYVNVELK